MKFRILGPLEAEGEGQLDLGGPRQRAVLGYLLLSPNQPVQSDRLLEALWGNPTKSGARNSLQSTVSRLRPLLTTDEVAPRIISRNGTYQLRIEADELDALRFERLVRDGCEALASAHADPAQASTRLAEALSLWRGEVLEDLRDQVLEHATVARLGELRRTAVEHKAKADLMIAHELDIIRELPVEIERDPFNERLRHYLMLALYRVGRAADAVDVYFNFQQLLEDERGMVPSQELRQLNQEIQRHQVHDDYRLTATNATGAGNAAARAEFAEAIVTEEVFVGREPELRRLREAVTAARAGQGRLVLIGGEMGIGKSHLVRHIVAEVKNAGLEALWGRVWEDEGAPVYWPWLRIMRQLLDSRDNDWLRQRLGPDAAVVGQVVPEVAARLRDLPVPPRLEPSQDQFRMLDSFTRFLQRAASDRPLVLVLDDLHRADVSSLLLLKFLTQELREIRLLVVATYRDSRADQGQEFVRALAELTREPVTTRIVLQGFDEAEVGRFVQLTANKKVPAALIARLHERTKGNPLFLKETVLPLADGQDLIEFEQRLEEFVPRGVQEAIERRLAYIPPHAREVLNRASVIGQQFTLAVLAEVAELEPQPLLELLDEVISLNYVNLAMDASRDRYRFDHVLIRDALYERLPAGRRATLHERVGEALEKVYADELEVRYGELAHHFVHAAGESGSAKSLDYLERAGREAVERLAFADAVGLFESALQQPTSRLRRFDLLLALADAQMRAGSARRARSTFQQAADTAKALGDTERFAQAALGFGGQLADFGLVNEQLIELLEEALHILDGGAPALRARLLGRLAEALYWVDSERNPQVVERRAQLSHDAVQLARQADDPHALAAALHGRWYATWRPENAEERRTLAIELQEVASRADNQQMALLGRMWSVITALELGEPEAADRQIEGYEIEARALGQRYLLALPTLWRATRAMMQGRFQLAEDLNREALALSERAPDARLIENAATLQQWFLNDERNRRDELEGALEGFVGRFPGFPSWKLPLALMRLAQGEPEQARLELDQFASEGFGRIRRDANWLASITLLAEICAALGDTDRAPELYELLAPYGDRCVVIGFAAVCRSSASLQLAQLAALLHRWEVADQHFSAALTANRRIGARPALAHSRYRYARALLVRGRGDDRERAYQLLHDTYQEASQLGMVGLVEEVTSTLASQRRSVADV